jgi:hypothetical protein
MAEMLSILRYLIRPDAKAPLHENSRVRALADIETRGIVYYLAPSSEGLRIRIPRDSILVVYAEPTWLAFSCRFEDDAVERRVLPQQIFRNPGYGGLALVFFRWEIGRRLEIIPA